MTGSNTGSDNFTWMSQRHRQQRQREPAATPTEQQIRNYPLIQ